MILVFGGGFPEFDKRLSVNCSPYLQIHAQEIGGCRTFKNLINVLTFSDGKLKLASPVCHVQASAIFLASDHILKLEGAKYARRLWTDQHEQFILELEFCPPNTGAELKNHAWSGHHRQKPRASAGNALEMAENAPMSISDSYSTLRKGEST